MLLSDLQQRLVAMGLRLRINHNRRVLVSLRWHKRKQGVLSVHEDLLDDGPVNEELWRFGQEQGRGRYPIMRSAMDRVFARILASRGEDQGPVAADLLGLPTVPEELSLAERMAPIARAYFPELPLPRIGWARNPGQRPLRSIRFGSYRSHPEPRIAIHPRLAQAWVAAVFLDHVIHHELCHHAQRCHPRRGESPHSARFRAWERQFSGYESARRWEKAFTPGLLDPARAPASTGDGQTMLFSPATGPGQN